MDLILSRHGNTFGPDDPVVIAGRSNDLPLVEKGIEQAHQFAEALLKQKIRPAAIYSGPLQRTQEYGKILIERLQLPYNLIIDERLNEIDYGDWTGLTNAEITNRFGKHALEDWDERCLWPENAHWAQSPEQIREEAQSFVKDLLQKYHHQDTVVAITSNGRLRYFLNLIPGELEKRIADKSFKVKTGNICKIRFENNKLTISYWNQQPTILFSE